MFPHFRFTNLMLISPHGIPAIAHNEVTLRDFPMASTLFTSRELNQLSLPATCQIIFGRAVTMDSFQRILHVSDNLRIPFDYLIIGTGTQFLSFDISVDSKWLIGFSEMVCKDACVRTQPPNRMFQLPCSHLSNFFVVNDAFEADHTMSKIEALRESPRYCTILLFWRLQVSLFHTAQSNLGNF